MARHAVDRVAMSQSVSPLLGIFVVNISGSFIFGMLAGGDQDIRIGRFPRVLHHVRGSQCRNGPVVREGGHIWRCDQRLWECFGRTRGGCRGLDAGKGYMTHRDLCPPPPLLDTVAAFMDRGYVRVVETGCQSCLTHDGIDVYPFHRGELVEHLDRNSTFEERVLTEVDGSLSACPYPFLQFAAIDSL